MTTSPLVRDIGTYLVQVLLAYKGMVGGSLAIWFVSSVVLKVPKLPSAWKTKLEVLKRWFDYGVFFLLLLAPFNVWRSQRDQLDAQSDSLAAAVARAESLQAAIPQLRNQLVADAERLSAEKTRRIVGGLSQLIRKADSLRTADPATMHEHEARWTASARRFLRASGLDETYLTEFDVAAEAPNS